ncbi:nicotinamidase-related amidase [Lachnospiraceae bacterium PF1-21]|uniref:Hydrolase n=1 Tax=Ohessyouella blattaphilus TaxID=2949333 RepID=A0ABT1EJQ8_9FIRM|nr:hydrolase [Ohessyouella blattaphilus]MCP1110930.1 hydrolase [Ohessyouella blattaphilus]MCR8564324.1 hydrolase [Ohessyouella blattaphilus]MDL2250668.1 hydrolase [Lachnospiraceae bacterium OttesenSCG-928-J05]
MRYFKEDTMAILIDVQERLVPVMDRKVETVAASVRLIEGLRILGVPVVPFRQYPKGLGDYIPEIKEALGSHEPSDKLTFSAYGSEEIAERIDSYQKKNVLIFGMETHICVQQTALDLIAKGYNVMIVTDCVTSRKKADSDIALRRLEAEGALLTTTESILFELLKEAGSESFKQISRLIK